MNRFSIGILMLVLLGQPGRADAQHPSEVQKRTAAGEHFAAITTFDAMPKRSATVESRVSAARSAWGLGLADRALSEFDIALRSPSLSAIDQARLLLSKGIIHFQEQRFNLAVLQAERAYQLLEGPSPLRGRVLLLWGEALFHDRQYGLAVPKYSAALEEVEETDRSDIFFQRAVCREKLGNLDEARADLMRIPLRHERASQALRQLAQISLARGQPTEARVWLERGRNDFADDFIDSWVDYALVQAAIAEQNLDQVRAIRRDAEQRFPPSDGWLVLLEANAEQYEWQKLSSSLPQQVSSQDARAQLRRSE